MALGPRLEALAGPGGRGGRLALGWLPWQQEAGMRYILEMEGLAWKAISETSRTFHILKNKINKTLKTRQTAIFLKCVKFLPPDGDT